jgi:hypothetical protein
MVATNLTKMFSKLLENAPHYSQQILYRWLSAHVRMSSCAAVSKAS